MTAAAAAVALAPPRARTAVRGAMLLLILSATVLQRFGITSGAVSASAALLVVYLFLVVAGAAGALALSFERTLLYGVCASIAVLSLITNEQGASFTSLLLLAAMYLPFVFVLRPGSLASSDASWVIGRFLDVALFCAIVGICQFFLQVVIHGDWLFDFSRYIPEQFRAAGIFNPMISIGSLNKANGFFFREPSGFSFMMALSLIAECVSQRRTWRIVCLGVALLLTYSGTGILALLLGTLHPFGAKTVLRLCLLAVVGALVFWLLGDALNLSFTLGRVNEFSSDSTQSSGYIRYVAPYRLLTETFDSTWSSAWLGHGPGTILRTVREYSFHDPTWAKLLFEYGALGFVAFVSLFLVMLRRPGTPMQLRGALFWGWLIMGGHLLSPEQNFLALALVGFLPFHSVLAAKTQAALRPEPTPTSVVTPRRAALPSPLVS